MILSGLHKSQFTRMHALLPLVVHNAQQTPVVAFHYLISVNLGSDVMINRQSFTIICRILTKGQTVQPADRQTHTQPNSLTAHQANRSGAD